MRTTFAAILLLVTTSVFAQVDSARAVTEIQDRLDIYFKANEEKDFDTILDMVYPKLFDLVPREQMKSQFVAMDAGGMRFSIYDMATSDFSVPFVHAGEQFVLVDYTHGMDLILTDSTTQASAGMMLAAFQGQYGEDKVSYDQENYNFTIDINKKMLAIAPLDSDEWTFLDFNSDNPAVLNMLFDEAVAGHFTP